MARQSSIFSKIVEIEESGNAGALCTVIASKGSTPRSTGAKMLVYPDGQFIGTVGGGELENRVRKAAVDSISNGRSTKLIYNMADATRGDPGICGGQVEVYVEPILPAPTLVVIGGGHVGKAVAHLAKWIGFKVVVSDDRPEFCTKKANPDADVLLPIPMNEIPKRLAITPQTYLVLTTRGTDIDVKGLPELLKSPAAYIGVIGSRRRWMMTADRLLKEGVSKKVLQKVHSPIGLEIRAETPEEIAVSILSEIILLRNGGDGKSMKMNLK